MLLRLQKLPRAPLCGLLIPSLPSAWPAACRASWQQLGSLAMYKKEAPRRLVSRRAASLEAAERPVLDETGVEGMSQFLDSLKWDTNGLVAVIVQVRLSF